MKKILQSFLVLLLVLSLFACSSSEKPAEGDGDSGDDDVRVALMVGFLGDLSFNDSAHEGVMRAKEELGVDVSVIEYGDDPNQIEPTLLDTADEGYDIVIGPSQFGDYLEEYAEDYPDTTFVLFDETVDYDSYDLGNVYSVTYSGNEGSFAAGYLAAKQSETGVIGFLGGEEAPVINDFLVGYIEGAKHANPDVKVVASFVGNWSDSAKGKELSLAMINQKADILFGAAGGATMGIFEAAIEKDVQAIGVDFDQAMVFKEEGKEDFAEVTISSMVKNVGDSLYRAIDLYLKGELKVGEEELLGIKENGVGLADNEYYEKLVDEDIRKEVSEILESIASGEIEVSSYYGMDTETFQELKDSVRP